MPTKLVNFDFGAWLMGFIPKVPQNVLMQIKQPRKVTFWGNLWKLRTTAIFSAAASSQSSSVHGDKQSVKSPLPNHILIVHDIISISLSKTNLIKFVKTSSNNDLPSWIATNHSQSTLNWRMASQPLTPTICSVPRELWWMMLNGLNTEHHVPQISFKSDRLHHWSAQPRSKSLVHDSERSVCRAPCSTDFF